MAREPKCIINFGSNYSKHKCTTIACVISPWYFQPRNTCPPPSADHSFAEAVNLVSSLGLGKGLSRYSCMTIGFSRLLPTKLAEETYGGLDWSIAPGRSICYRKAQWDLANFEDFVLTDTTWKIVLLRILLDVSYAFRVVILAFALDLGFARHFTPWVHSRGVQEENIASSLGTRCVFHLRLSCRRSYRPFPTTAQFMGVCPSSSRIVHRFLDWVGPASRPRPY